MSSVHPSLTSLALVAADQIDDSVPAYDDDHVRHVTPEQVSEYERMLDVVMEAARAAGRTAGDVLCEVLSTCPAPLACVMQRHGLGRFRVTQKASLVDREDGYRGENADPRDWIMIGNHDTEPLLAVLDRWERTGQLAARAEYLASRLGTLPSSFQTKADLANAMFAELFVGPAANVLVFFADLFGERETYNTPGLVSDANWSMRVPRDFRGEYARRVAEGTALSLPRALALAMRARGETFVAEHASLLAALEKAP